MRALGGMSVLWSMRCAARRGTKIPRAGIPSSSSWTRRARRERKSGAARDQIFRTRSDGPWCAALMLDACDHPVQAYQQLRIVTHVFIRELANRGTHDAVAGQRALAM